MERQRRLFTEEYMRQAINWGSGPVARSRRWPKSSLVRLGAAGVGIGGVAPHHQGTPTSATKLLRSPRLHQENERLRMRATFLKSRSNSLAKSGL